MKIHFSDQHLLIQHAKESDSGLYVCRAENSLGFKESSAHLLVSAAFREPVQRDAPAPRMVIAPYDMEASRGSTIEIPCKAEGSPRPTIVWSKNGQPLSLSRKHR